MTPAITQGRILLQTRREHNGRSERGGSIGQIILYILLKVKNMPISTSYLNNTLSELICFRLPHRYLL